MNPPVVKKCKDAHLLFKKLQGLVTNCNVISYSGIRVLKFNIHLYKKSVDVLI